MIDAPFDVEPFEVDLAADRIHDFLRQPRTERQVRELTRVLGEKLAPIGHNAFPGSGRSVPLFLELSALDAKPSLAL